MGIPRWQKVGDPLRIDGNFFKKYRDFFRTAWNGGDLISTFGKAFIIQPFQMPGGGIENFVQLEERDAAKIIGVTATLEIITIRQYKQGVDNLVHELPGGSADFKGERPEDIIAREFREETGFQATSVIQLGPPQYMSTRNSSAKTFLFLAEACQKIGEQKLDPYEGAIEIVLVPLSEWIGLCLTSVIDPYSIVATFRALSYLGEEFGLREVGI